MNRPLLIGSGIRRPRRAGTIRRRRTAWCSSCEVLERRLLLDVAFGAMAAEVLASGLVGQGPPAGTPGPELHMALAGPVRGPVAQPPGLTIAPGHAHAGSTSPGLALGLGHVGATGTPPGLSVAATRAAGANAATGVGAQASVGAQAHVEIAAALDRVGPPALLPAGRSANAPGNQVAASGPSVLSTGITADLGQAAQAQPRTVLVSPGGDKPAETAAAASRAHHGASAAASLPATALSFSGTSHSAGEESGASVRSGNGESRDPGDEAAAARIPIIVLPSAQPRVRFDADDDDSRGRLLVQDELPAARQSLAAIQAAFVDHVFADLAHSTDSPLDDLRADKDRQIALLRRTAAAESAQPDDFVTPLDFGTDTGERNEAAPPAEPVEPEDAALEPTAILRRAEAAGIAPADEQAGAAQRAWWIAATAAATALASLGWRRWLLPRRWRLWNRADRTGLD